MSAHDNPEREDLDWDLEERDRLLESGELTRTDVEVPVIVVVGADD